MTLLYFSPVLWHSFSQRSHHFVRWYQEKFGGKVYWIDPYPSRFPKLSDVHRLAKKNVVWHADDPPWLTVIRPRLLPIEPIAQLAFINRNLWRMQLNFLRLSDLFRQNDSTVKVVIGKPSDIAWWTAAKLKSCDSLYDGMDDVAEFHTGMANQRLKNTESAVIEHSGTVWASSQTLFEKYSNVHKNVVHVPNGLAISSLPQDITYNGVKNRTLIAGYVGAIGDWFDWAWLDLFARTVPEYAIHLIGSVHTSIPKTLSPNITFFDALPHIQAVAQMQTFKFALIPFKINQLTQAVDPIKYYEYKALGLPILSSEFGQMIQHKNEPGVFMCDDEASMKAAIHSAENYAMTRHEAAEFAKHNSWQQRFDAAASSMW